MKDIIIVGAGGCGREVANFIEDINKVEKTWNILGFIDDNMNALDEFPSKYKVIDSISNHVPGSIYYAMGIANPLVKKKIASDVRRKGCAVCINHPSEYKNLYRVSAWKRLDNLSEAKISTGCQDW